MDQTPEPLEASTVSPRAPSSATGKKRLFRSPNKASRPRAKHYKLSATEEALAIMKGLQERNTRDQYTVFGEEVGMRIRDLPSPYARKVVKHVFSTILFDAEMGKYDNPSTTHSQPSPYLSHLYSHPPSFGFPVHGPIPGTSSVPLQVPTNVYGMPTPSHQSQHSVTSPVSLTDSCDPGNTDSDSIDNLLMEL